MQITQEKLNEIIASHGKWLRDEEGGQRAYLRGAYLRGADLIGADLRGAYLRNADLSNAYLRGAYLRNADLSNADLSGATLSGAYLRGAYLRGADLSGADLSNADLSGATLRGADLSGAYLRGAYLRGATLDDYIVQVVRIGSRKGTTTYNATADNVLCGCWNNYKGGTLAEFEQRVEDTYGKNSEYANNEQYYAEYVAAIAFFKAIKERM